MGSTKIIYLPKFETWHPKSSSRRERKFRPAKPGGDAQINGKLGWITVGFQKSSAHCQQRSWPHSHWLPATFSVPISGKWKTSGIEVRSLFFTVRVFSLGKLDRPVILLNWLSLRYNTVRETSLGILIDVNEQSSNLSQASLSRPVIRSSGIFPWGLLAKDIHMILGVYREKSGISVSPESYRNSLPKFGGRMSPLNTIGAALVKSKSQRAVKPRK